ncbi:MAG: FkbM family methyltransferase [Anaerolineaceae bacterium]|nr:FkbM family methyltransferase [Anaerolineaceae bacterium]
MTLIALKHYTKLTFSNDYRKKHQALSKLRNLPRYTPTTINILGNELQLIDAASFFSAYKEIFERQIYKFKALTNEPTIIDAGANIGLSVLYFKKLYPKSKIIAFEPDTTAFKALRKNVHQFNLSNTELVNKAVWISETVLEFINEGADAGRISQFEENGNKVQVNTVRLRDYLNQPVDFLKLDIEGAETKVLEDCQDLLANVQYLFVEYHSFVDQPHTLSRVIEILSKAGYRFYIDAPVKSHQPFVNHRTYLNMDLQLNIFAFRR